ncbi:MAG: biotin-dependent carboxyltransferase family protein [Armatimonadetes bacterium]|nr:biotin-dependent carboxyltransferase family protein [Armatimonadota bacterium]
MSLILRQGYGIATIQGAPNPGYRKFGVPPGGAFDMISLAFANALVGNVSDLPTVELALFTGTFESTSKHLLAAVGAEAEILVNGTQLPNRRSFLVSKGDSIEVKSFTRGCRLYLASKGGFFHTLEGPLPRGAELESAIFEGPPAASEAPEPSSLANEKLRIVPGPHANLIDFSQLEASTFKLGVKMDRVGIRLEGPILGSAPELPSEPSVMGAIQLTPAGELIIHGPDGPTVGGYPKVAAVISADWPKMGQLTPGQELKFELDSLRQARIMAERHERKLRSQLAELFKKGPSDSTG